MTATKKRLTIFTLVLLTFLAIFVFAGCNPKFSITSTAGGKVEEFVDEDGNQTYTAIADKWNDFMGWYNGEELYSADQTITKTSNTPNNLVAKFDSNAMLSFKRAMEASYNKLSLLDDENYINISSQYKICVLCGSETKNYNLSLEASLTNTNNDSHAKIILKTEENIEKLSILIKNNAEKLNIYLKLNQKLFSYEYPSISQFISRIIDLKNNKIDLESILGKETYENIFGYENQINLFVS